MLKGYFGTVAKCVNYTGVLIFQVSALTSQTLENKDISPASLHIAIKSQSIH